MATIHNAMRAGFRTRRPGDGPIWVRSGRPPLPRDSIATAEQVTLQKGEQYVLVRSHRNQSDGSYIGVIDGFEPSKAVQFDQMKVGDQIEFQDEDVVGATAAD